MGAIDHAARVINYESPGLDARLILADHLLVRRIIKTTAKIWNRAHVFMIIALAEYASAIVSPRESTRVFIWHALVLVVCKLPITHDRWKRWQESFMVQRNYSCNKSRCFFISERAAPSSRQKIKRRPGNRRWHVTVARLFDRGKLFAGRRRRESYIILN